MPEALMRLSCPACLGVALESASVADGVNLHHCGRCGGTWLLRAQIARLRAVPDAAVRTMIRRTADAGFLCHGCHSPMHRDDARCPACRLVNTLECPSCGKPLNRQSERDVTVDVCRGCEAVWLDHHELSSLWSVAVAGAVVHAQSGTNLAAASADAGSFLLDALWYAPDLTVGVVRGAAHLAGAGLDAASHAPDLLSSLPEGAGGALEGVGNLAGAVFEIIAKIIGGIFEGLGNL